MNTNSQNDRPLKVVVIRLGPTCIANYRGLTGKGPDTMAALADLMSQMDPKLNKGVIFDVEDNT